MKTIVIAGLALATASIALGADTLVAAKNLYASAAFEDALATLGRLDLSTSDSEAARQAEEYRAFCLYALGRIREAESVAEAIVRKEPLAQLSSPDASPRIQAMFTDVRKRLLPSLLRDRFRAARTAFDAKDFTLAVATLAQARSMIAEANKIGASDPGLADLGVLVDGFLELTRSAVERAQPSGGAAAAAGATAAGRVEPAAPATPAPTQRHTQIYSSLDDGVVPPVAIDQRLPSVAPQLLVVMRSRSVKGVLDVVIDEQGKVVETELRQSLNSAFDQKLLEAARQWKYRPATRNGDPVAYRKTLLVTP
jgi:TonB family protein